MRHKVGLGISLVFIDQLIVSWVQVFHYTWINMSHQPFFWLPGKEWIALGLLLLLALITKKLTYPLILMIAGFCSNLISLLRFSQVLDYIHLFFWYTNTADLIVVAGCIWLGFDLLFGRSSHFLNQSG